MTIKNAVVLGMPVEVWQHKSCTAQFGVGPDYATLYAIQSMQGGRGHATELLMEAKYHYESKGKKFGGSVALNGRMQRIYKRLGIREYNDFVV